MVLVCAQRYRRTTIVTPCRGLLCSPHRQLSLLIVLARRNATPDILTTDYGDAIPKNETALYNFGDKDLTAPSELVRPGQAFGRSKLQSLQDSRRTTFQLWANRVFAPACCTCAPVVAELGLSASS